MVLYSYHVLCSEIKDMNIFFLSSDLTRDAANSKDFSFSFKECFLVCLVQISFNSAQEAVHGNNVCVGCTAVLF